MADQDAEVPPSPLSLDVGRRLIVRTLLPGLYAWVTTVAYPATFRDAPTAARVLAFFALVALVAGPLVSLREERPGRALGIFGFLALSVATWLLLGPLIAVARIEPVRAASGGVGWALFALGWGQVRDVGRVPEDDPNVIHDRPLTARGQLPRGASVALAVGLVGALIPLLLAWRVDRPDHALLGHAAAVAGAVALLVGASRIALERGNYRPRPARTRLSSATPTLSVLVVVLALGVMALLLW